MSVFPKSEWLSPIIFYRETFQESSDSVSFPKIQKNHTYLPHDEIEEFAVKHFASTFNGFVFIAMKSHLPEKFMKNPKLKFQEMAAVPVDELVDFLQKMHASPNCDYYITANTMRRPKKRSYKNLFTIDNIVIDIDCHAKTKLYDPESQCTLAVNLLRNDLFDDETIPHPNSVVYTGRGIQLWWRIDTAYVKDTDSSKTFAMYQRIKDIWCALIAKSLRANVETQMFTVDKSASRNAVGYFRLPYTTNCAVNKKVTCEMFHDTPYQLSELLDRDYPDVLGEERIKALKSYQYNGKPVFAMLDDEEEILAGIVNPLAYQRVVAMLALREMRNAEPGDETRNIYCWVVFNNLLFGGLDPQEAFRRTMIFNLHFCVPLPEHELYCNLQSSVRRTKYRMTNATIIDKLDISEEEQEAIQLFPRLAHAGAKPGTAAKACRHKERNRKYGFVVALHIKGYNNCAISRITGFTRPTIIKYVKLYQNGTLSEDIQAAKDLYLERIDRMGWSKPGKKNEIESHSFEELDKMMEKQDKEDSKHFECLKVLRKKKKRVTDWFLEHMALKRKNTPKKGCKKGHQLSGQVAKAPAGTADGAPRKSLALGRVFESLTGERHPIKTCGEFSENQDRPYRVKKAAN